MGSYLVTSALPYANGPIHFGHVAGAYLPADVTVRYLRMTGEEVLYVCGTDEYGVAITLKAEQEGLGYREYLDRWHREIKDLFGQFDIHFDIFSGTARCPQHQETAQTFFTNLLEHGWVKDRVEKQWFSEKSQRFLPDRYLQGTCPECSHPEARGDECPSCGAWIDSKDLGNPISLVDGSAPMLKDTRHWYLDLPGLLEHGLKAWYQGEDENRPHHPWKPNVDGHVQEMLRDLRERPITRDLPWGIPLPDGLTEEESKVLYVWFDAPIGYLSQTMEWAAQQGDPDAWKKWWLDADTRMMHFIGKDNIAFHLVVFPAMLLGQKDAWEGREFNLPWAVPAHEFYNLQGKKFSTSAGWHLDNQHFFETYNKDVARFHLLLTAPETADSEFTWEGFQATNNALLADKLGNFASRVLKFTAKRFDGKVPAHDPQLANDSSLQEADRAFEDVGTHLSAQQFKKACRALLKGCDSLNQFFDAQAPWKLIKSSEETDVAHCGAVIERCIAYLELLSRRFQPFCPSSAQTLRTMLGEAAKGSGDAWGRESSTESPTPLACGALLGEATNLFPKIDDAAVAEEIERLEAQASAADCS